MHVSLLARTHECARALLSSEVDPNRTMPNDQHHCCLCCQVLLELLPDLANDVHGGRIGALRGKLEMAGSGIILWSDFW